MFIYPYEESFLPSIMPVDRIKVKLPKKQSLLNGPFYTRFGSTKVRIFVGDGLQKVVIDIGSYFLRYSQGGTAQLGLSVILKIFKCCINAGEAGIVSPIIIQNNGFAEGNK